jgi:hypothetical protein
MSLFLKMQITDPKDEKLQFEVLRFLKFQPEKRRMSIAVAWTAFPTQVFNSPEHRKPPLLTETD